MSSSTNHLRGTLTLAVLIAMACHTVIAATVAHVSRDGNDGHPGTRDQPVATIAQALALVWDSKEPAEIVIHEGVYSGGVSVGAGKDRDIEGRPNLVIRAARKQDGSFEEVILEGGLKIEEAQAVPGKPGVYKIPGTYSYHRRPHMWEADTRTRYTLMADLAAVERYPASFWFSKAETFLHTSDHSPPSAHEMGRSHGSTGITVWRQNVTVSGLKFRSFLAWRYGCAVDLRTSKGAVEDCHAWNCVRGFTVSMEPPRDCRIARCRADDCAMGVYSHGTRTIVEDCRFTKIRDAFLVPAYPQDDTGIQCYSPAFEGEIRRNACVGFCNGIFLKCRDSRFVVEHNTCVDGITFGIGCTKWHPESVFRYNIVVGFSSPVVMGAQLNPKTVVDYNCFWGAPEATLQRTLTSVRRADGGRHNITADPQFYGPAVGDYRLLEASPCVTSGEEVNVWGALPIVPTGAQDVQPPYVVLSVAEPARRLSTALALWRERDPRMGGAPNRADRAVEEWLTPAAEATLEVEARDAMSRPANVRVRVGDGPWGRSEPLRSRLTVSLPGGARRTTVAVRVDDAVGNWSEPTSVAIWQAARAPQVVGEPEVRANANGAVMLFTTDAPCKVTLEVGEDRRVEPPADAQRAWAAEGGAQRIDNVVALTPPLVKPGATVRYRLILEDELGNTTTTHATTVVLQGEPQSYYVSPTGKDDTRGGQRAMPWETVQYAVDRALPGDRIVLRPGVYPGETVMTHGGIEGAPITIEAEREGAAVLDSRHHANTCLTLRGAPHVVIRGLEVRWFGSGDTFYSYDKAGIAVHDSPHVTVANCKIWNDFWMGWPIGSGIAAWRSPDLVADHNVIYQMEQGIRLDRSPRSHITHNTILMNMYGAVKFFYSAEGTVSRNNSFCFSGNDQYLAVYADKKELDTFESDHNNLGTKLRSPGPGDEIVPRDPFFRHHGSKAVISLNGERYSSLRAWQEATGKDMHSIFADPKYIDPENWDFRLQSDSPNIGRGEGGTTIGALGVKAQQ